MESAVTVKTDAVASTCYVAGPPLEVVTFPREGSAGVAGARRRGSGFTGTMGSAAGSTMSPIAGETLLPTRLGRTSARAEVASAAPPPPPTAAKAAPTVAYVADALAVTGHRDGSLLITFVGVGGAAARRPLSLTARDVAGQMRPGGSSPRSRDGPPPAGAAAANAVRAVHAVTLCAEPAPRPAHPHAAPVGGRAAAVHVIAVAYDSGIYVRAVADEAPVAVVRPPSSSRAAVAAPEGLEGPCACISADHLQRTLGAVLSSTATAPDAGAPAEAVIDVLTLSPCGRFLAVGVAVRRGGVVLVFPVPEAIARAGAAVPPARVRSASRAAVGSPTYAPAMVMDAIAHCRWGFRPPPARPAESARDARSTSMGEGSRPAVEEAVAAAGGTPRRKAPPAATKDAAIAPRGVARHVFLYDRGPQQPATLLVAVWPGSRRIARVPLAEPPGGSVLPRLAAAVAETERGVAPLLPRQSTRARSGQSMTVRPPSGGGRGTSRVPSAGKSREAAATAAVASTAPCGASPQMTGVLYGEVPAVVRRAAAVPGGRWVALGCEGGAVVLLDAARTVAVESAVPPPSHLRQLLRWGVHPTADVTALGVGAAEGDDGAQPLVRLTVGTLLCGDREDVAPQNAVACLDVDAVTGATVQRRFLVGLPGPAVGAVSLGVLPMALVVCGGGCSGAAEEPLSLLWDLPHNVPAGWLATRGAPAATDDAVRGAPAIARQNGAVGLVWVRQCTTPDANVSSGSNNNSTTNNITNINNTSSNTRPTSAATANSDERLMTGSIPHLTLRQGASWEVCITDVLDLLQRVHPLLFSYAGPMRLDEVAGLLRRVPVPDRSRPSVIRLAATHLQHQQQQQQQHAATTGAASILSPSATGGYGSKTPRRTPAASVAARHRSRLPVM